MQFYFVYMWQTLQASISDLGTLLSSENSLFIQLWKLYIFSLHFYLIYISNIKFLFESILQT